MDSFLSQPPFKCHLPEREMDLRFALNPTPGWYLDFHEEVGADLLMDFFLMSEDF